MIYKGSRYVGINLYQGTKGGESFVTMDTSNRDQRTSQSARTHRVIDGDTLENLSFKYYGDPVYWWLIADDNELFDPHTLEIGTLLNIP